jgi:hypothetical protein
MDAPLDIKALLYVPSFHQEKYGMGRMDPDVSLYSRKILVEPKSPDILPEWCRFIKGVVDSEDLPLSISREKTQYSALVGKMRKALTRKVISHLSTMMRSVSRFFFLCVKSYSCVSVFEVLLSLCLSFDKSTFRGNFAFLMLFLYFTPKMTQPSNDLIAQAILFSELQTIDAPPKPPPPPPWCITCWRGCGGIAVVGDCCRRHRRGGGGRSRVTGTGAGMGGIGQRTQLQLCSLPMTNVLFLLHLMSVVIVFTATP